MRDLELAINDELKDLLREESPILAAQKRFVKDIINKEEAVLKVALTRLKLPLDVLTSNADNYGLIVTRDSINPAIKTFTFKSLQAPDIRVLTMETVIHPCTIDKNGGTTINATTTYY